VGNSAGSMVQRQRQQQPKGPAVAACMQLISAVFSARLSFLLLQMLIESRIANRTPLVDVSETEFYRQTALKHPKQVGLPACQPARHRRKPACLCWCWGAGACDPHVLATFPTSSAASSQIPRCLLLNPPPAAAPLPAVG
jgi:hypothetical protein